MVMDFPKLVKLLEMTTSTYDGEVLNAIRMANKLRIASKKSVVYVLDVVKRFNGEMTLNQITQKTRKISNRDRLDILTQLVESGDLVATKDGKKTTFRVA